MNKRLNTNNGNTGKGWINNMLSKKIISILLIVVAFIIFVQPYHNVSANENPVFTVDLSERDDDINHITSKAAIVIDYATGFVIYELNADELRVPASMTKVIAAYVVLDAVRDGIVDMDTGLMTSDSTSAFSYVRAYTNVPMPPESSYTVRELLEAVIIRSACAATIALGEGIFGSDEALIAKMNEKTAQLGIDAVFHDSWGGSPHNRISARGMAEITMSLIRDYPEILDITSKNSIYFNEVRYNSTNILLGDYEGIDGIKTGFTNPAGWCFTGTAIREERRIISVTMGSVQGYRFPDSVVLLDYGFNNFGPVLANHFKAAMQQLLPQYRSSSLMPAMIYSNVDEARSLGMRELAVILNGS